MEAPVLIPGKTSDQGFNLDLEKVYTPQSNRQTVVLTPPVIDGFYLRQRERQISLTMLLFLGTKTVWYDRQPRQITVWSLYWHQCVASFLFPSSAEDLGLFCCLFWSICFPDPHLLKKEIIWNLRQTGHRNRGLKLWHTNDISIGEESACLWVLAYSCRQQKWQYFSLERFIFSLKETKMVQYFGFAWKKKRRLLPALNSECFTPGCIDFSCYCRSATGNWIGNCRKTLLFYLLVFFFSAPPVFSEASSEANG